MKIMIIIPCVIVLKKVLSKRLTHTHTHTHARARMHLSHAAVQYLTAVPNLLTNETIECIFLEEHGLRIVTA